MKFTLTIEGDSLLELADLLTQRTAAPAVDKGSPDKEPEPEEVAEGPAPKSTRRRKGAAKEDTPSTSVSPESSDGSTATTSASPSDEKITLDDLRAAAEPLMANGKGREIQEMLLSKFNVRAFGPLPEEQYPAALAELQDLGG